MIYDAEEILPDEGERGERPHEPGYEECRRPSEGEKRGDSEDFYRVEAELPPGFSPANLEISAEGNQVSIRGHTEHREESEEEGGEILHSELESHDLSCEFTFPISVETEDIESNFDGSILTLSLPKSKKPTV